MTNPKQERSRETRLKILKSAEESFAKLGYDATGVAEICQHAGTSKGAFYHHFASKQAVFIELLGEWLANLNTHMTAILQSSKSVPEALLNMGAVVREVFEAGGHQLHIFLEFLTKAVRDPTIWQSTIRPYRQYRSFFADIIAEGVRDGSLKHRNPEVMAQILVSLGVGIVFQGILDPHGARWEEVTQEAVHLFVEGIIQKEKT